MKKLFIITGEYSGDIHASHVVEALRAVNPDIEIEGIALILVIKYAMIATETRGYHGTMIIAAIIFYKHS